MKNKKYILIAGDLCPVDSNYDFFNNKELDKVFSLDLLNLIKDSVFYFNLECVLGENLDYSDKTGPSNIVPSNTIKGIKELNPDCLFLANNHIKDGGENGIKSTIKLLKSNNINYIGVGENINKLKKDYIVTLNNKKIGFYNLCENEFSIATNNSYGANGYDEFNTFDDIRELKTKCDKLIVLYHGGKEHYQYVTPWQQKLCRKFVDCGANLVICQHSHCIGCNEVYKNSNILYGQGNFCFNRSSLELWKTGLLVKIDIDNFNVEYIPIERNDIISISNNENILKEFNNRSEFIKSEDNIKNEYDKLSDKLIERYITRLNGNSIIYKKLRKFIENRIYNKKNLLYIYNYVLTEAHRELLINGLMNKIKGMK